MTGPQYSSTPPVARTPGSPVDAIRVALEKLDALGSARQIAEFFEREGARGATMWTDRCPVAMWLRRTMGITVHVTSMSWDVDYQMRYALPDVVSRFVQLFDDYAFPNLIDQSVVWTRV